MSGEPLPLSPPPIRVASTVELTEAEGPGARFAIWTQGCTLACPDCCNPHLWSAKGGVEWTAAALLERVLAARARRPELEGVTLIGGEPFEQDVALAPLAAGLRAAGLTVMAFTGYWLEDLQARRSPLLPHLDLLVDGPYERERYTSQRRFIGSSNQRMHVFSDAYSLDDPRFAEPNTAELRYDGEGDVQVVGFPFPSVRDAFGPKRKQTRGAG